MQSKAFDTSKVGIGYIGNSVISLYKRINTNLLAQQSLGHYAFHNSASLTRLQLHVLNFCLLFQASLIHIRISDSCHSSHEFS